MAVLITLDFLRRDTTTSTAIIGLAQTLVNGAQYGPAVEFPLLDDQQNQPSLFGPIVPRAAEPNRTISQDSQRAPPLPISARMTGSSCPVCIGVWSSLPFPVRTHHHDTPVGQPPETHQIRQNEKTLGPGRGFLRQSRFVSSELDQFESAGWSRLQVSADFTHQVLWRSAFLHEDLGVRLLAHSVKNWYLLLVDFSLDDVFGQLGSSFVSVLVCVGGRCSTHLENDESFRRLQQLAEFAGLERESRLFHVEVARW